VSAELSGRGYDSDRPGETGSGGYGAPFDVPVNAGDNVGVSRREAFAERDANRAGHDSKANSTAEVGGAPEVAVQGEGGTAGGDAVRSRNPVRGGDNTWAWQDASPAQEGPGQPGRGPGGYWRSTRPEWPGMRTGSVN
jgi:hypothetical protein